ncbi:hypothetical protein BDD43_2848 [Mucilaginibacter gracilis]|uniref:Uncharacterized protein n=1 Tax=Mucilaginibacter gracilis TaxID=423350 RepID=A0A495J1I1_9SPHI|nr:SGNH/GDSL hydrolase family protein [Mucilaginibacter gracilis]RKR82663.1 hypothetical protein BDD43_2848 [Mucilaginibacter gracilis]
MDISNFLSGVTHNITSQTAPKSILGSTVGNTFTDLANLTKTTIESLSAVTFKTLGGAASDNDSLAASLATKLDILSKATGAQALAGSDDTAYMTPLKTSQIVAFGNANFKGTAVPTDTPVTGSTAVFWIASQAGTYTNFGNVVVNSNSIAVISWNGTAWSISQSQVIQTPITSWSASTYTYGTQVNYNGMDWVALSATTSTDVPGVSTKWTPRLSFYTKAETDAIRPLGYDSSAYAYAVVDSNNNLAFTIDKAGKVGTPKHPDLDTSISTLENYDFAWQNESGYVWGVCDTNLKVAMGIDLAGNLILKGQSLSSTLSTYNSRITAIESNDFAWQPESGYQWGIVDSNLKIPLGINQAGHVLVSGQDLTSLLNSNISAQLAALTSARDISCWGDSLTQGAGGVAYATQLAALLADGRNIYNNGVGGDTSPQIAFRQGGINVLCTITANTINASGATVVTPANANIMQINRTITGSLFRIKGTLARLSDGTYTFTRTLNGSNIATENQVYFIPDGTAQQNNTLIFWAGQNDPRSSSGVTDTLTNTAAMVAFTKAVNKRFLVMSVLGANAGSSGGTGYNYIIQTNQALRDAYPDNFIDVRQLLIRSYDSSQAQDVIDHTNDIVPTSLRSDAVHLNTAGYGIVAQAIKDFLLFKNW